MTNIPKLFELMKEKGITAKKIIRRYWYITRKHKRLEKWSQ